MLYSHRANLYGPHTAVDAENSPQAVSFITSTFENIFIEIDVRNLSNETQQFALGHDKVEFIVSESWLMLMAHKILLHAKDVRVANWATQKVNPNLHFFLHNTDDYGMSSLLYFMRYPGRFLEVDSRTIIMMPERELLFDFKDAHALFSECAGVCTDYPLLYNFVRSLPYATTQDKIAIWNQGLQCDALYEHFTTCCQQTRLLLAPQFSEEEESKVAECKLLPNCEEEVLQPHFEKQTCFSAGNTLNLSFTSITFQKVMLILDCLQSAQFTTPNFREQFRKTHNIEDGLCYAESGCRGDFPIKIYYHENKEVRSGDNFLFHRVVVHRKGVSLLGYAEFFNHKIEDLTLQQEECKENCVCIKRKNAPLWIEWKFFKWQRVREIDLDLAVVKLLQNNIKRHLPLEMMCISKSVEVGKK